MYWAGSWLWLQPCQSISWDERLVGFYVMYVHKRSLHRELWRFGFCAFEARIFAILANQSVSLPFSSSGDHQIAKWGDNKQLKFLIFVSWSSAIFIPLSGVSEWRLIFRCILIIPQDMVSRLTFLLTFRHIRLQKLSFIVCASFFGPWNAKCGKKCIVDYIESFSLL